MHDAAERVGLSAARWLFLCRVEVEGSFVEVEGIERRAQLLVGDAEFVKHYG